jgi:hypothetical protein
MPKKEISYKIFFGHKAKSGWGLKGCSCGMYSTGGFDFYRYGIKYLFAFEIMKRWGDFRIKK